MVNFYYQNDGNQVFTKYCS